MIYLAAYDVSRMSLGNLTVGTSGESNAVVDMSAVTGNNGSSIFFHSLGISSAIEPLDGRVESVLSTYSQDSYAEELEDALQAAATSASWADPDIEVTFSATTGKYTIFHDTVTISLTWASANGQALLGFSGNKTAAASHEGDVVATHAIIPTIDAVSEQSPLLEAEGIGNYVVTDDDSGYGISRPLAPKHRDWLQQYEVGSKTYKLLAEDAHPWTFEHLFEQCRNGYSFLVLDGFGENVETFLGALPLGYACNLRGDGLSMRPVYAWLGADVYHISFRTHVRGFVASLAS